jgi:hypothetical protein
MISVCWVKGLVNLARCTSLVDEGTSLNPRPSQVDCWASAEYLGGLHAQRPEVVAILSGLKQGELPVVEYKGRVKSLRDRLEDLDMEVAILLLCLNMGYISFKLDREVQITSWVRTHID